jgi:hypothetical protein
MAATRNQCHNYFLPIKLRTYLKSKIDGFKHYITKNKIHDLQYPLIKFTTSLFEVCKNSQLHCYDFPNSTYINSLAGFEPGPSALQANVLTSGPLVKIHENCSNHYVFTYVLRLNLFRNRYAKLNINKVKSKLYISTKVHSSTYYITIGAMYCRRI